MLSVGKLAHRFGLSRSTLLYYERIGLLQPSGRSRAGYRQYSTADVERLERIVLYRQAGLPLADVARLLSSRKRDDVTNVLADRLRSLGAEIGGLRRQQRLIVKLLRGRASLRTARYLDKQGWVAILEASGMDEDDMKRWHVEFERHAPEAHQDFLESLGIKRPEIERIRDWSRRERIISER